MRNMFAYLALAATALLSAPAMAVETIELSSENAGTSGLQGKGEALEFDSDLGTVTVTGWSVDRSNTVREAQLGVWSSGVGVLNGRYDNSHTIDNSGWVDFILLEFETLVALQDVQFNTGWHWMNDTDATIGFGIVSVSDISSLAGETWPIEWLTTFESGERGRSGSESRNVNPDNAFGDVWLIGASFDNPDWKKDGFKISSIHVMAVPEPSTWMMFILGLGLVGGVMRKSKLRSSGGLSIA